MPWRLENGVKVFDIRVEHVRTHLIPGRVMDGWGFNGSIPGPTIQVNEGDRVRLNVENRLPEPFSMHWHGLEIGWEGTLEAGISVPLFNRNSGGIAAARGGDDGPGRKYATGAGASIARRFPIRGLPHRASRIRDVPIRDPAARGGSVPPDTSCGR